MIIVPFSSSCVLTFTYSSFPNTSTCMCVFIVLTTSFLHSFFILELLHTILSFCLCALCGRIPKRRRRSKIHLISNLNSTFFNTFYPRIIENRRILHLSINSIFSYFWIMFMFNIHNSCCSFLSFRLILIYLFFSSFRFYFILFFILLWFFLLIRISPFCC